MAFQGISNNAPSLGGVSSSIIQSVLIAPCVADKPYVMGAGVVETAPAQNGKLTKAFIKAGATLKGIMSLGGAQIQQRGGDGIVRAGYDSEYNQIGVKGAFWAALDLANFTKADVDGLTAGGVLSVDANGVFSYGTTAPAGNTTITSNVTILNYYDKAIVSAVDETISVGGATTTIKYANGIGAILIAL